MYSGRLNAQVWRSEKQGTIYRTGQFSTTAFLPLPQIQCKPKTFLLPSFPRKGKHCLHVIERVRAIGNRGGGLRLLGLSGRPGSQGENRIMFWVLLMLTSLWGN